MKPITFLFSAVLAVFLFSCQSEPLSDFDPKGSTLDIPMGEALYEILGSDATKEFSHTPTGVVFVETADKSVKIDFNCDENLVFQSSDKHYLLLADNEILINTIYYSYTDHEKRESGNHLVDTVRTIGQLISLYSDFTPNYPRFNFGWESFWFPQRNAEQVYSTVEYLLSQACFQDDCRTLTRQAVLKMAVRNQTYKFQQYLIADQARNSGVFLMSVILAKEEYPAFIAAVSDNPDLQNAMCMNIGDFYVDEKLSNLVSQYAIDYLLDK